MVLFQTHIRYLSSTFAAGSSATGLYSIALPLAQHPSTVALILVLYSSALRAPHHD
jgi:hypothetical protein